LRNTKKRYRSAIKVTIPSQSELEKMAMDMISDAVDGCGGFEADSCCKHGYPTWLSALGYI
jgi:hypothetical protein